MNHDLHLSSLSVIKTDPSCAVLQIETIDKSIEYFQQYPDYLLKKLNDLQIFESSLWQIDSYSSLLNIESINQSHSVESERAREKEILLLQSTSFIFHKLSIVINYKKLIQYLPNDNNLIPKLILLIRLFANERETVVLARKSDRWLVLNFLCHWLLLQLNNPFKLSFNVTSEITDLILSLDMSSDSKCNKYMIGILLNKDIELLIKYYNKIDLQTVACFLKETRHCSYGIPLFIKKDWEYLIYKRSLSSSDIPALLKIIPNYTCSINYMNELLMWYIKFFISSERNEFVANTEYRFKLSKSFCMFLNKFDTETILKVYHTFILPNENTDSLDILHLKMLCLACMVRYVHINGDDGDDDDDNDGDFWRKLKIKQIINKFFDYQSCDYSNVSDSSYNKIRDAINFIIWESIRSPNFTKQNDLEQDLFFKLLCSSLFDYDLNIRRSALATLHELLGRFDIFDNITTVELMTVLDIINFDNIYSSVIPKIFHLFAQPRNISSRINERLLERMILINVLKWKKINVMMASTDTLLSLRPLYGAEICDIACTGKVTLDNCYQYLYLFSKLQLRLPNVDVITLYKSSRETSLRKIYSPETSFQYLTIIQVITFLAAHSESQDVSDNDLTHVFNVAIFTNRINKDGEYLRFLEAFIRLLPFLENCDSRWETLFFKLLSANNKLIYNLIPHMRHIFQDNSTLLAYFKKADHTTKATLINALSDNFPKIQCLESGKVDTIMLALDDYTLTQQGDVGRLVRESCCKLIAKNIAYFQNTDCLPLITSRLIRIAGEPNESLQKMSFEVLLDCHRVNRKYHSESHYTDLINFYNKHDHGNRISFLNGYISTAGAIHSTDLQITRSINALLDYYHSLSDPESLQLVNELVRQFPTIDDLKNYNPKVPKTNEINSPGKDLLKTTLTVFKFWERFLQNNVILPYGIFNYKGFFAKIFNLHSIAKNLKVSQAFVIVGSLICCNINKQQVDEEFITLVQSKIKKISQMIPRLNKTCSDALNLIKLTLE